MKEAANKESDIFACISAFLKFFNCLNVSKKSLLPIHIGNQSCFAYFYTSIRSCILCVRVVICLPKLIFGKDNLTA